jgi:hypothetical protein
MGDQGEVSGLVHKKTVLYENKNSCMIIVRIKRRFS